MRRFTNFSCGSLILAAASFSFAAFCAHAETPDPHAHHHMTMSEPTRSVVGYYRLPNVSLVREDGKTVSLASELDDGRPVIMNFIYTTCTTICPITSQTFSQLQTALGSEKNKIHLVSISIDPEQDTPARLRQYARKYSAGSEWNYYTGSVEASIAAQRAFDVYRGDKMNHNPVTLLRTAPGKPWLRIDGFSTAAELLDEYQHMIAAN